MTTATTAKRTPGANTIRYDRGAILRLREKQGLTRGELAARTGMSINGIGYIEKGFVEPRAQTLARIATGLGVSIKAFFQVGDESA